MATRLAGPGGLYAGLASGGRWTGLTRFDPGVLDEVLGWTKGTKKPRMCFMGSMCDVFHENNSFGDIATMFMAMSAAEHFGHAFVVLTKRPERATKFFHWLIRGRNMMFRSSAKWEEWPQEHPLLAIGVSAEDGRAYTTRVLEMLKWPPQACRVVSCEPLLGGDTLEPWAVERKLDWVIVGGENGHGAREMPLWLAGKYLDECRKAGIPYFFKGYGSGYRGCAVSGMDVHEFPEIFKIKRGMI
jgi:protein gp37